MSFGDDEAWNAHNDGVFTLVGTLLIDKVVKLNSLKETMASIWRIVKGMMAKEITMNLFIFQFFHEKGIRMVLEDGSWSFEHFLILHQLQETESPFDVDFSTPEFWVQIHRIPKRLTNLKMEEFIASQLGDFVKVDLSNYDGTQIEFIRLRVRMDTTRPLGKKNQD